MPRKRLTPIERHIEGVPHDRRARYVQRIEGKGLKRITLIVPTSEAEAFRDRARDAREQHLAAAAAGEHDD